MAVRSVGDSVLVFEPEQDLRDADFEALVAAVGGWLDARGELPGLVIHARVLPGWHELGCVVRHVRFVRGHRNRIHRIALATNTPLLGVGIRLAEILVAAEVKQFVHGALDRAVRWAARGGQLEAGHRS